MRVAEAGCFRLPLGMGRRGGGGWCGSPSGPRSRLPPQSSRTALVGQRPCVLGHTREERDELPTFTSSTTCRPLWGPRVAACPQFLNISILVGAHEHFINFI